MSPHYGIHLRGGLITERDADFCTVRVRVPAGNLTVEQLRGLAAIADPQLRSPEEAAADAERRSPDLALARAAVAAKKPPARA